VVLIELVTRFGIVGQPSPVYRAVAAHGYLMIYGLFPFFMFGFLMTPFALDEWYGNSAAALCACFLLMLLGAVAFYVGLSGSHTILVVATVSVLQDGAWRCMRCCGYCWIHNDRTSDTR